jgi:hypothetical protein
VVSYVSNLPVAARSQTPDDSGSDMMFNQRPTTFGSVNSRAIFTSQILRIFCHCGFHERTTTESDDVAGHQDRQE